MKTEANFSLAVCFCFYIYLFSRNSKKDKIYKDCVLSVNILFLKKSLFDLYFDRIYRFGYILLQGSVCQYAASCTPFTARPLGSFMFLKAESQARASAVEQATLGMLGTLRAALSLGKCSSKMVR